MKHSTLALLTGLALSLGLAPGALAAPPAPEKPAQVEAPPPPASPPAPPPPPPPSSAPSSTLLAGVAFGLSAVGVAVGTVFGVRAFSAQSDFDRTPTQALADKQRTSAVISDGSFGGAIVLAVVGAVFITQRRAIDAAPPAAPPVGITVVPLLSPTAQGAAVRLRF